MNTSRQVIVNASAHSIPLPSGMIHTVACSPPYYSLRQYQGEQEIDWPAMSYSPMPGLPPIDIEPMRCALGLEPTPEAYIGHLVLCFREVHRVMRDDAACWIVMGDSYNASPGGGHGGILKTQPHHRYAEKIAREGRVGVGLTSNLHQGDLMLIPARLALALQADSWIVRNDVVWAKVAPMPESVSGWHWSRHQVKVEAGWTKETHPSRSGIAGDISHSGGVATGKREGIATWQPCPGCEKCEATGGYVLRRGSWRHTRAHETVLMCVKSMGYYADQERVREKAVDGERFHGAYASGNPTQGDNGRDRPENRTTGRNPRSVLTPSPESYPGSHYAVFSRTLIAPLLRATAPTRVCPVCGAPWAPVVEKETGDTEAQFRPKRTAGMDSTTSTLSLSGNGSKEWAARGGKSTVLAHRPTCDHDADPIPGWALDPFAGTFTTGEVCAELGVNAIGIDISPEYLDDHAKPRIGLTPSGALDDLPLFAELEVLA